MPKRSDREEFEGFDVNPFEDFNPEEIYKEIQWGNDPKELIEIEAPEALVALGHLAAVYYYPTGVKKFKENKLHLAVGAETNFLYIFPKKTLFIPGINDVNWIQGLQVKETHYYSEKGNEECYYYHEHETPFPIAYHWGMITILLPQNMNGKRSYAVIKEGIVG